MRRIIMGIRNMVPDAFAGLIALAAAATFLAVSLTGCDSAAGMPRTPPKAATPAPTLLGTWERTTVEANDDGTVETEKQLVTITDTHFIERNTLFDADGVEIDNWDGAGT